MKIFLIVMIPLFAMGIIAYIISNNSKKADAITIILNGVNFWKRDNNQWYKYDSINDEDFDWKQYRVYFGNKYIDKYYVTINNLETYFFDKNNDSYDVEYPYIAIDSGLDYRPVSFRSDELYNDDIKIINSYFEENGINYEGDYNEKKKYIVDINGDNKEDYIYILSNELYTQKNAFYLVFAFSNNKFITIDNQINKESFTHYDLIWVLNMKSDGYYHVILNEPRDYNEKYFLCKYNKQAGKFDLVFMK